MKNLIEMKVRNALKRHTMKLPGGSIVLVNTEDFVALVIDTLNRVHEEKAELREERDGWKLAAEQLQERENAHGVRYADMLLVIAALNEWKENSIEVLMSMDLNKSADLRIGERGVEVIPEAHDDTKAD